MGVLTDVFAAKEDELTPEVFAHGPLGRLPAVEGKGLDIPEFITLTKAAVNLSEDEAGAIVLRCFDQARLGPSGGDPVIVPLPEQLTSAIAAADVEQLMRIRVKFEERDEAAIRSDVLFGKVPDWLDEYAELCRNAQKDARKIYVWMCP